MLYGFYAPPSISVTFVPDHVYFMIIRPLGPARTRVVGEWLFHPEAAAAPSFDPKDAIEVFDITNRQDFDACERMQIGAESRHFEEAQMHVPHEYLINEFRKRVDDALTSGNGFMMDGTAGSECGLG
jgi:Rieske 2Fe-2S family protein